MLSKIFIGNVDAMSANVWVAKPTFCYASKTFYWGYGASEPPSALVCREELETLLDVKLDVIQCKPALLEVTFDVKGTVLHIPKCTNEPDK